MLAEIRLGVVRYKQRSNVSCCDDFIKIADFCRGRKTRGRLFLRGYYYLGAISEEGGWGGGVNEKRT